MAPMASTSQRGFLWARHPEVAKEFESKTPKGKKLPFKVGKGKAKAKKKPAPCK